MRLIERNGEMIYETWAEMAVRHRDERIALLEKLSDAGYTQTEAANLLGITLQPLNNFIQRNGIKWKTVRQGAKSREV